MKFLKDYIKLWLKKNGKQIKGYPDTDLRRQLKIMQYCKIDTLLDIGANTGQYAHLMREIGYNKKIISFEPIKVAFETLQKAAVSDDNWDVNHCAIGNEEGKSLINIAGNSVSSSILKMLPKHLENAPESEYFAQEEIEIKKLDTIFNTLVSDQSRVMLKIDTQGYEKNVIDGAINSLAKIWIIQLEMSLVPLYENEMLFAEMINYLSHKGFQLYSLENVFSADDTGQLLQVDGIFVNKALVGN